MTNISAFAFSKYTKSFSSKQVTNFSCEETKETLQLFTKRCSVFADRYDRLHIVRDDGEDLKHFVNKVRAALKRYLYAKYIEEQFSYLVVLITMKSATKEPLRIL